MCYGWWWNSEPSGYTCTQWTRCSQCDTGYTHIECPTRGNEVCRSCSSRCERCYLEECNECGLGRDLRCGGQAAIGGNAAQGHSASARTSSSDGVPRSQKIGRATAGEGRLDVKSAFWYGNNLPVPLGGDEFSTCPVAESAVSPFGRNLSEGTGQLDDAEPPPPLLPSSSASADGARWDESSSSASTQLAAEPEAAVGLTAPREQGSASSRPTGDANDHSQV